MMFFRVIPMQMLRLILILCALGYFAIAAAMFLFQRQLQYFPTHRAPSPADVGLADVQLAALATPDGERLTLWYAPATGGQPTILFFQGNAGEIADRAPRFSFYRSRGFGVAFLSYRGFGGSTGRISETGLITDALTAHDWLLAQGIGADRIVLVGESLGTGVAVQLAAQRPVGALILGAPYTAAVDVAVGLYGWLPVRWLMKDQFRSRDHIAAVTAPLLILHGTEDRVIPFASGHDLFAAANEPKQFVKLHGAGHQALFDRATWVHEAAFLASVLPP
jgi:uncharacterized protein